MYVKFFYKFIFCTSELAISIAAADSLSKFEITFFILSKWSQ